MGRVDAEPGKRELGHVGLAQKDGAGERGAGENGGVALRNAAPERAGRHGRLDAGDIDQILPGDRHAVERAETATRALPLARGDRLGAGARLGHPDEHTPVRVLGSDAAEKMPGKVDGIDLARCDSRAQGKRGHVVPLRHRRALPMPPLASTVGRVPPVGRR